MDNISLLGNQKTEYKYDKPDASMLEWFDSPSDQQFQIDIVCPEFTSLCPKTGQPDFAKIVISYVPDKKCVESKSLKLYLFAYRNFGEFHEACVNRIADDLVTAINPLALKVQGQFMPRGGISIWPTAERRKK